jgi:hypothetical protein
VIVKMSSELNGQSIVRWWPYVIMVMNLKVPAREANFDLIADFLRGAQLHTVNHVTVCSLTSSY